MISSTLWAEVTISGFIFLMSGAFLAMKYLGVRDVSFLAGLNDYAAVIGVGAIAASYIIGILAHRLIMRSTRALRHTFRKVNKKAKDEDDDYSRAERARVAILQYGSERLLKEMDYQFNFLALFSQLSVAFPALGICSAWWLLDTAQSRLALPALAVCLLMGIGFIVARANQDRTYRIFKNDAYLEVAGMRKKAGMENVTPGDS